jgi:hypothetical protein
MAQVSVQPFYSGRAYYDVTSADGQKYVFVPKEFVEKGFVQNGQQFYSPGFLTPEALTTASAFTLPDDSSLTGAAKSIYQEPTKGFLWKADDFNKINYDDFSIRSYQPNNTYGLIKGYTLKDGVPYYIQEPSPGANYTLLDKDGTSTNTTVTVTRTGGGGGGLFGGLFGSLVSGLSSELAKLDPSAAISKAATDLFQPVEKAITAGVADVSKALSTDDAKKAMAIAAAYYLPGVGASLGKTLVTQGLITGAAIPYAAAIGTALASTGASVAQGVPFDTALTNATINAVTSTGSQSVAGYISKLGASPEVANAVTSVGASGLATAAKGGSAADIERNMTGALAGSTITSMTGDKIAGAAVGGQITGGTTGALLGAAGAAGAGKDVKEEAADIEKEQDATSIVPPAKPDVVSSAERDIRNLMANISPGVQTADMSGGIIAMPKGVRDETAEKLGINLPRIGSDMTVVDPETKGTLPTISVVAPRDEPITFQEGQPDLPELNKAGEGLVIVSDKTPTGGSSVSPADQKVLDLIKPTTVTPQTATPATFTPAIPQIFTPAIAIPAVPPAGESDAERTARRNEYIERTIAGEQYYYKKLMEGRGRGNVVVGSGADAGAGNATGNVVVADAGGGNAAGNVVVGPGDEGGGLGGNVTIDVGGGGNATSNVSGNVVVDEPPAEEVAPPNEEDKPPTEEEKPPAEEEEPPEEEDKPPGEKEDKYKPDLFIYGGKTPKPRPRTELGTTLQGPFAPSTTLGQALTGYRGAGEIEGKKTGKPRREVWNEESLRLKDALGL